MAILPLAATEAQPPTTNRPTHLGDAFTTAMARIDGCPSACGNTEAPTAAIPTLTGWMASYACSDCGLTWTTSWKD